MAEEDSIHEEDEHGLYDVPLSRPMPKNDDDDDFIGLIIVLGLPFLNTLFIFCVLTAS